MLASTPLFERSSLKAPASALAASAACLRSGNHLFMEDMSLTLDGFALPPELPPGSQQAAAAANLTGGVTAPLSSQKLQQHQPSQQQWFSSQQHNSQQQLQDVSQQQWYASQQQQLLSQQQQQQYYASMGTPSQHQRAGNSQPLASFQLPAPQLSALDMQYLAAKQQQQQQQQAMMASQEQQRPNLTPITFPVSLPVYPLSCCSEGSS